MPLNLDQYVSVHAAALDVRARRGELIAKNLANADTPGYQARDIDGERRWACGEPKTRIEIARFEYHAGRGGFDLPPQRRLGRLAHGRERLDTGVSGDGLRGLRAGRRDKQPDSDQGSP